MADDNGQLRKLAQDLLDDSKATQHQKLNGLIRYAMSLENSIQELKEEVGESPFSWIPKSWRKKAIVGVGIWAAFITITAMERVPILIEWLKELNIF